MRALLPQGLDTTVLLTAPGFARRGLEPRPARERRPWTPLCAVSALVLPALIPAGPCNRPERRLPASRLRTKYAAAARATSGDGDADSSGSQQLIRDSDGRLLGITQPVTVDKLVALCVLGLPWRSVAAWTVTLSMAYALRDFMGLAGTTFILSYLGNSLVDAGAARMPPQVGVMKTRRLLAVCMYALIILAVVGFGLLTIPSIMREGADLVSRIQAENPYVLLGEKLRLALGDALASKLERSLTLLTVGSTPSPAGPAAQVEVLARLAAEPVDVVTGWGAARAANFGHLLQSALKQHTSTAVNAISTSLTATSKFTLQGLVSVVLSFIIVWDRGTITAGAASLRASRLGWIYAEVAPALGAFGSLFGKALQAQLLVAIVNTALTALGMLFLELPGVAFLSVIVFFCSFVPVAGVIVSTMPIGFVALTEYGVGRLVGVIVMVLAAHAVEAYLLNPLIYSAHLKLHPLLVIIVLVLAEHSLGVWGLLLAVPFTVFVVEYVIKTPQQRVVKLPS